LPAIGATRITEYLIIVIISKKIEIIFKFSVFLFVVVWFILINQYNIVVCRLLRNTNQSVGCININIKIYPLVTEKK
jgi:hypothetical protein